PCFGSLFPPLAALTFAASSIICAFDLASAAPRSPYRHLELCGIALDQTEKSLASMIQPAFRPKQPEYGLYLYLELYYLLYNANAKQIV
ncbi:MAG: hypothetical protein WAZ41_06435, partial [Gemmiger qucibialis]